MPKLLNENALEIFKICLKMDKNRTRLLLLNIFLEVVLTDYPPKNAEKDKQQLSRPIGKQTICIGENKDADQLRGNREADQRLCFRYSDSTIPLLLNSKISSF